MHCQSIFKNKRKYDFFKSTTLRWSSLTNSSGSEWKGKYVKIWWERKSVEGECKRACPTGFDPLWFPAAFSFQFYQRLLHLLIHLLIHLLFLVHLLLLLHLLHSNFYRFQNCQQTIMTWKLEIKQTDAFQCAACQLLTSCFKLLRTFLNQHQCYVRFSLELNFHLSLLQENKYLLLSSLVCSTVNTTGTYSHSS